MPERTLRPVQQPRIPIWVVGAWNRPASMERAVRYDGVVPHIMDYQPDDIADAFEEMAAWVRHYSHADGGAAEVIWEAKTPADDPAEADATVTRWRDRGATWWLESRWGPNRMDVAARIETGPPGPIS